MGEAAGESLRGYEGDHDHDDYGHARVPPHMRAFAERKEVEEEIEELEEASLGRGKN
jgi:hypothetical protein